MLRIMASRKNLAELRNFVGDILASWQIPRPVSDKLRLAADEAVTNVLLHGYQNQEGLIELELKRAQDTLILVIRDYAPAFDPTTVACTELDACLLDRLPGGLGLRLIRNAVDELRYCRAADGANVLTFTKRL